MGKRLVRKRVKESIPKSAGIMSTIAARLGCSWNAARDFIVADPELSQMLQNEMEGVLDMAESVVYQSAKDGNTHDAKWLLSKKGKARGFGDKVEVENTGDVTVRIEYVNDWRGESNQ